MRKAASAAGPVRRASRAGSGCRARSSRPGPSRRGTRRSSRAGRRRRCRRSAPRTRATGAWRSPRSRSSHGGTGSENPSISRRNRGLTASGVTSRGAKPVPPVERITSTPSSSTQARTWARIASTSSRTIALPASSWPAAVSRVGKQRPGLVRFLVARVGYRQHGDAQRMEGQAFVDSGQGSAPALAVGIIGVGRLDPVASRPRRLRASRTRPRS